VQKFTTLTAAAAPLMRHNVDTDVIINVDRLMMATRAEMGLYAFEVWRYLSEGVENPEFELNRPGFRTAKILIAGRNFGCGSSREMAVWAVFGMGFRCVIAPSFGDIFASNCAKNGLLAIALKEDLIERLAVAAERAAGAQRFTVDLENCTITLPNGECISFEFAAGDREALLSGLDEIGQTLRYGAAIAAFQVEDRVRRPWIYEVTDENSTKS
jgi:3-isopropylmalate/(R)-2-methylmalate dehydratase small subunit